MILKKKTFLGCITSIIILTFLWSQTIWAFGSEISRPQKNLPNNIQEKSPKESRILDIIGGAEKSVTFQTDTTYNTPSPSLETCTAEIQKLAFLTNPTPQIPPQIYPLGGQTDRLGRIDEKYGTYDGKKYKWQAISYDELGRPTAYKEKYGKVSSKHYDILYNELGDVAYEKVKVTVKSGGLIKSKTKILTEYWYGYDEYGQREKIKEHEIYRKTSTSGFGRFFSILTKVVQIVAFFVPGLQPLAMGLGVVNTILQGDPLALVAQIAGAIVGNLLGNLFTGATQASGLLASEGGILGLLSGVNFGATGIGKFWEIFQLVDGLVADITGKGIMERAFGENAGLVSKIFSVFATLFSGNAPPSGYQILAALGKIGLAIGLEHTGLNPYLKIFLGSLANQFLDTWAGNMTDKARIKESIDQGTGNTQDKNIKDIKPITRTDPITGKETTVAYIVTFDDGSQAQLDRNKAPLWYVDSEGTTYFYGLDKTLLGSLPKGWTAMTDELGNPVKYLVPRTDGNFDVYDLSIQKEGVLPKGTIPWIGDTGLFTGSIEQTQDGRYILRDWTGAKIYELDSLYNLSLYDTQGNLEAFIPAGNEPIYNTDDRVTGSYKAEGNTTYIYNHLGELDSTITRAESTTTGQVIGYFIETADSLTYTDAEGVSIYDVDKSDPFAPVKYYDFDGETQIGELITQLTEQGLTKSFVYKDLENQVITKYNAEGDYEGTYNIKTDDKEEIIGYYGINKDGNYEVLDIHYDRLYTVDKDTGIATIYGIDPEEIYLILRPDATYVVDKGADIYVLGIDQETGKLKLYNYMGTFVTDNPIAIVGELKFSLLSLPLEVTNKLLDEANTLWQESMPKPMPFPKDKIVDGAIPISIFRDWAHKDVVIEDSSSLLDDRESYLGITTEIVTITPGKVIFTERSIPKMFLEADIQILSAMTKIPFLSAVLEYLKGNKSGAIDKAKWEGAIKGVKFLLGKAGAAVKGIGSVIQSYRGYGEIATVSEGLADQLINFRSVIDKANLLTKVTGTTYNDLISSLEASDIYNVNFSMKDVLMRSIFMYLRDKTISEPIPRSWDREHHWISLPRFSKDKMGDDTIVVDTRDFGRFTNYEGAPPFSSTETYINWHYGVPDFTATDAYALRKDMAYAYKLIVEYGVPVKDVPFGEYIIQSIGDIIIGKTYYDYNMENYDIGDRFYER